MTAVAKAGSSTEDTSMLYELINLNADESLFLNTENKQTIIAQANDQCNLN